MRMSSPSVIDLESLLSPIAGDNASGVDLRADISPESVYQAIKLARRRAGDAERLLAKEDPNAGDPAREWAIVLDKGTKALSSQAKDLEIAAWLVEALLRKHGYAGLRDGLKLCRELSEKYWDTIYPLPTDDEGLLPRVGKLRGLNGEDQPGTLIQPIRAATWFLGETGPVTWITHSQAQELEKLDPDKRQAQADSGVMTMEVFTRLARASVSEIVQTCEDLREALVELENYSKLLDDKCSNNSEIAPQTGFIREALNDCLSSLEPLCPAAETPVSDGAGSGATTTAASGGSSSAASGSASIGNSGGAMTRERAFALMLELSVYFKKNEPHSPLGWTLEHWVKLGRMDLPQLLAALPMSDDATRKTLATFAGVPVIEQSSN
jgi:type VI secretion system protein ImpA